MDIEQFCHEAGGELDERFSVAAGDITQCKIEDDATDREITVEQTDGGKTYVKNGGVGSVYADGDVAYNLDVREEKNGDLIDLTIGDDFTFYWEYFNVE